MVTYVKGDLFKSPAQVLVNTVNTVGVMGKGIAKTFKTIYPEMFTRYQRLCETNQLTIGKLWLYKTKHKWILNFPTKVSWRQPSKPEYIEEGLRKFVATYSQHGITSIAFPQLGCGNGELDWQRTVRPIMEKHLDNLLLDIFVYIYDARFTAEHKTTADMIEWLHREPRSLAFSLFWDDLTASIGDGMRLRTATGDSFMVTLAIEPPALVIKLRDVSVQQHVAAGLQALLPFDRPRPRVLDQDKVLVPRDCMLDLWQAVRAYGFCTSRTMPGGLDVLSPYLIPLLAQLDYMTPVELSRRKGDATEAIECGLQLYDPPRPQDHQEERDRLLVTAERA